jgi:hypothetical protein
VRFHFFNSATNRDNSVGESFDRALRFVDTANSFARSYERAVTRTAATSVLHFRAIPTDILHFLRELSWSEWRVRRSVQ